MTDQATTYRHYLNVYGPDDLLIWSERLPREQMDIAKRMAGVDASDPEALSSYPLTHDQAMKLMPLKLLPEYSVMLEPMADDAT
jgi:hypothetical protein